jgi:hypothetical protein
MTDSRTSAGKGRGRGESVSGVDVPSVEDAAEQNSVVLKVGMVGDAQIGKTSLMVRSCTIWAKSRASAPDRLTARLAPLLPGPLCRGILRVSTSPL